MAKGGSEGISDQHYNNNNNANFNDDDDDKSKIFIQKQYSRAKQHSFQ